MSDRVEEVLEKEENAGVEKEKNVRNKIIIAAAAVMILAVIIFGGIRIYSAPERQLAKQLDLGNRYLEEMDYEQAIAAFNKVIEIDPKNVDAYLGKADAYIGLGDSAMAIETLEAGYQATGEDGKIKEALIRSYIAAAEDKNAAGMYEECLEIYDLLLEYDSENADVLKSMERCLNEYISILMGEERYDEIKKLAAKYQDILKGIDFNTVLEQIEEIENAKRTDDEAETSVQSESEPVATESSVQPESEPVETENPAQSESETIETENNTDLSVEEERAENTEVPLTFSNDVGITVNPGSENIFSLNGSVHSDCELTEIGWAGGEEIFAMRWPDNDAPKEFYLYEFNDDINYIFGYGADPQGDYKLQIWATDSSGKTINKTITWSYYG